MLTCTPSSPSNWKFRISGLSSGDAEIALNIVSEQGHLHMEDMTLTVQKQGPFSGRWLLKSEEGICAEAFKQSLLFRDFQIQADGMTLELKAPSAFHRRYEFIADGRVMGSLWAEHAMTRQCCIECDESISERTQVFAFWLATLGWQRGTRNSMTPPSTMPSAMGIQGFTPQLFAGFSRANR